MDESEKLDDLYYTPKVKKKNQKSKTCICQQESLQFKIFILWIQALE